MELQSLGYFGAQTRNMEDWAAFGSKLLGLQVVDRTRTRLTFRMDDRRQRVMIHGDGQSPRFSGWEVVDARALDSLAARLEQHGVRVERLSSSVAGERAVTEAIAFHDPAGNRLEAFYGPEVASDPFVPGRS